MTFLREDLAGQHYNWVPTINASALTGQPSRRRFDRFNGNQVLFIINYYGTDLRKPFTLEDVHKIEQMISYHLPDGSKSEISVFNWLKENCSIQPAEA